MSLAVGTRLGPYEITAALGAGGMGQVWRARDTRLEREVALKVLPAGAVSDETARARLVREARLASKLNHPHICTIYDVGESGGQTYIGMELVEGQPLSDALAGGPLPVEQVLRYGCQLADALSHAHARGVVHRDLKSANVMVTPEGQVKVLDFGLAKRVADDNRETTIAARSLTAPGTVAGTLPYMAPEQLRGQPADARSDVWALGVMLYEMAAGRRPFEGKTGFELTAAILSLPAPPAPAPGPVAAVVERCLDKEPGARYQGGSEVRAALEAVTAGRATARWPAWRAAAWRRRHLLGAAAALLVLVVVVGLALGLDLGGVRSRLTGRTGPIRLAVLPFVNASGDPGQEYLSDGLTQEMIALLGRVQPQSLSVIGRTSVMRYKKKDTPADHIGRELGVGYVLEGSVQRSADTIRITASLVTIADQTQLWADTYERPLSAMITVQGQVAQNVARALAVRLLPAQEARLAVVRTINPEAYDAYLRGIALWQTLETADADAAQRQFELALEKDPSYAPAMCGLAWTWMVRGQNGAAGAAEVAEKARPLIDQALALDDDAAEAHEVLAAYLAWNQWDWANAGREFRRTLEINPSAANAHAYYAHYLAIVGRHAEVAAHGERAIELDPFNPLYHGLYGMALVGLRRYDEALAAAHRAISIRADTSMAYSAIQRVYLAKGMRQEQLAEQRLRIARDPERIDAFDRGLAQGGYEGAQLAIADVLARRYEKTGDGDSGGTAAAYGIALRYMDGGDRERAITWLQKAFDVHDQNLPYLGWPCWDSLRGDPRFQALMRRVGLPLP